MARTATNQVTTIGIDSGKNSFHLIGLDGCLGSFSPVCRGRRLCPDLKVNRTCSGSQRTLALQPNAHVFGRPAQLNPGFT